MLSEKFCQDTIEEYFSKQRQRFGCNDNPTLHEFARSFIGLNVAGDDLVKAMNGNTKGKVRDAAKVDITNTNLPPTKKKKQNP